jgi:hypothetical protein
VEFFVMAAEASLKVTMELTIPNVSFRSASGP